MEITKENCPAEGEGTTRRSMIISGATVAAVGLMSTLVHGAEDNGISHSADAIHQEPVFKAKPQQVYEALTDAKQFDQVEHLSAAMQAKQVADKRAEIGAGEGAAFTLFGGYISGRQIELVPGKRIVQAWRTQRWNEGDYSIVKFELVEQGSGTKILFDHLGFPGGQADHLALGWKINYWEPLEKFLAKG